MTRRMVAWAAIAAVGVGVVMQRRRRVGRGAAAAPVRRPVVAETLEQPHATPAPTSAVEPPHESPQDEPAHILRPSPVPREHPVWTPPVNESSRGKHAARDEDDPQNDDPQNGDPQNDG